MVINLEILVTPLSCWRTQHDRGRKYEVDVKTREEITSLIAHHVTAVNYIYRNTKFDGRTEHRNIRFEVSEQLQLQQQQQLSRAPCWLPIAERSNASREGGSAATATSTANNGHRTKSVSLDQDQSKTSSRTRTTSSGL